VRLEAMFGTTEGRFSVVSDLIVRVSYIFARLFTAHVLDIYCFAFIL
jgi:hypothetical protein